MIGHRLGVLVAALPLLGAGVALAQEAQAASVSVTASAAPVVAARGTVQIAISPSTKTVHVKLPAAADGKLAGEGWEWGHPGGDTFVLLDPAAKGTVPSGAAEFDVPVPDYALLKNAIDSWQIPELHIYNTWPGVGSTYPYVPQQSFVDAAAQVTLAATGPAGVTADLSATGVDAYYTVSRPVTVPAGGTIQVNAPAGFFTHGPGGSWASPAAPAPTYNAMCGQYNICSTTPEALRWTAGTDGRTFTVAVPTVLPYDRSATAQDLVDVVQSENGEERDPVHVHVVVPVNVTGAGTTLRATVKPSIVGTMQVGRTLTARPGAWYPAPGIYHRSDFSLRYQWLRDGSPITFATKSTYALVAADMGHRMGLRVTARLADYHDGVSTVTLASTVAGLAAPHLVKVPTVTGTARVGYLLTAHAGTWTPKPASFTYRWYRDGKAITNAVKSTYRATKSDKGHKLTVKVTTHLAGHKNATATSRAVTIR